VKNPRRGATPCKEFLAFKLVKQTLETFDHIDLVGCGLAVKASANCRTLRAMGITIRKTVDTLIATRCIEDDVAGVLKSAGNEVLARGKARAEAAGVAAEVALFETMQRRLADVVVDEISTWPADLVVVGTHGRRGIGRWVLGSDAEQILRSSPVPVLLVRPPAD